jgi:tellurite resistance protein TerC
MMRTFRYLHYGIVAVLFFIGVKMLIAEIYEIPVGIALGVVASVLLASVIVSIIGARKVEVVLAPGEPPGRETKAYLAEHSGKDYEPDV